MANSAVAALYYVDYEGGSDSNSGTSKTAPWKHHPAMQPFSGSYTHAVGDHFIFKGGVTWPNAALPMYVTKGGTAELNDYHGIDSTWYKGSAWARPIFDAEGKVFTNHGGNSGNVVQFYGSAASYNTIEGIEMKNFVWNDPNTTNNADGWAVLAHTANYITIKNVYSHDWIVRVATDSKYGGFATQNGAWWMSAIDCIVKGPGTVEEAYKTTTGNTSGAGAFGLTLVERCDISNTTQGIFNATTIKDCVIHDACDSFDSATHENGLWVQNVATVSGNRIYNLGHGVAVYLLPGWGGASGCSIKFYNNILYNFGTTGAINPINVTNQDSPSPTNSIYVYNNIVEHYRGFQVGTTKSGEPFAEVKIQNNLIISDAKYSAPDEPIYVIDSEDIPSSTYTASANAVYTPGEATAAGLTADNFYEMPTALSDLVGKGVNLNSVFTTDFNGVSRGSVWDIGAFEWSGSPPPTPTPTATPTPTPTPPIPPTGLRIIF